MTPERFHRLRRALDRRQPDLTVLMDNVHKPHNFAAVIRTCDAVGVFEAHGVWPDPRYRPHRDVASGTGRWVRVRTHPTLAEASAALRATGASIVGAHPGAGAIDFRARDYTRPTALLLGAELEGVSGSGLALADAFVTIPMRGLGGSLNVSVAAAVVLYEAERQRAEAGLYDACRLDRETYERTLFEWAHPEVAAYCRRRARPYPALGDDGEILEKIT